MYLLMIFLGLHKTLTYSLSLQYNSYYIRICAIHALIFFAGLKCEETKCKSNYVLCNNIITNKQSTIWSVFYHSSILVDISLYMKSVHIYIAVLVEIINFVCT